MATLLPDPSLVLVVDEELEVAREKEAASRSANPEYGRTISIDWSTFEVRVNNYGEPIIVSGQECLIEEIVKILITGRFTVDIYDANYGTDLYSLFGLPVDNAEVIVRRAISEALLIDNRIQAIESIDVTTIDEGFRVTLSVRDFTGALLNVPSMAVRYG